MVKPVNEEADCLWIYLVWYTRLHWTLPMVLCMFLLIGMFCVGQEPDHQSLFSLVGTSLSITAVSSLFLLRWRTRELRRTWPLRALLHAQVIGDLVLLTAAVHVSGGPQSLAWFAPVAPVMGAPILFAERRTMLFYAGLALVLFALMLLVEGTLLDLGAFLRMLGLVAMVTTCMMYGAYGGRQLTRAHRAMFELGRLQTAKAAAEEIARRKDYILSLVSHELRNPLGSLRVALHLARERRKAGEPPPDRMIEHMDAQVRQMVRLVKDLYDLASVQAGQLRIEPRDCDLMTLLGQLEERVRATHPSLNVRIEGPDSLPACWDVERIDQLFTNLFINAAKYAGDKPTVTVRVLPAGGNVVHVEVSDDGPGIPPDRLLRVFEPFQRVQSTAGRTGLGLGLALARQIAALHGGAIWAESQPGHGTAFHLRLPTGSASVALSP